MERQYERYVIYIVQYLQVIMKHLYRTERNKKMLVCWGHDVAVVIYSSPFSPFLLFRGLAISPGSSGLIFKHPLESGRFIESLPDLQQTN